MWNHRLTTSKLTSYKMAKTLNTTKHLTMLANTRCGNQRTSKPQLLIRFKLMKTSRMTKIMETRSNIKKLTSKTISKKNTNRSKLTTKINKKIRRSSKKSKKMTCRSES